MRVRYTPRSRRDLRAILQYIDERNPQGALNVKRSIQRTIELIGNHPRSGRLAGIEDTHVLPAGRYPYLIYWIIEAVRRGSCTFATHVVAHGKGNKGNSRGG